VDFAALMGYWTPSRFCRRLCCAFHGPANDLSQTR